MSIRIMSVGVLVAVSISQAASAGITAFSNAVLWNNFVTVQSLVVAQENFSSYSGAYPSLTGSVGGVSWTASASSGGVEVQNGVLATDLAAPRTLTFTFGPGARAVGGNFFAVDSAFNVVPSIVQVSLANGFSYAGSSSSVSDFAGFLSTDSDITSITISVSGSGTIYAAADNLSVGVVPAPGAIALLGAAGAAARRRRRD